MVSDKMIHKAFLSLKVLEFTYKQIPLENIFIFTIYQNYTLADSSNFWKQK